MRKSIYILLLSMLAMVSPLNALANSSVMSSHCALETSEKTSCCDTEKEEEEDASGTTNAGLVCMQHCQTVSFPIVINYYVPKPSKDIIFRDEAWFHKNPINQSVYISFWQPPKI